MDHHIKFDGVVGESLSKDHKGEIEVLSWTWGLSSTTAPTTGGGSRVGKATPEQFTFTHVYDKASPMLATLAAAGRHVKQAWLTTRRASAGAKDFLKVSMTDVVITGVHQEGHDEGIYETVTATAARVTFEYRETSVKGTLGTPVVFDWDVVKQSAK